MSSRNMRRLKLVIESYFIIGSVWGIIYVLGLIVPFASTVVGSAIVAIQSSPMAWLPDLALFFWYMPIYILLTSLTTTNGSGDIQSVNISLVAAESLVFLTAVLLVSAYFFRITWRSTVLEPDERKVRTPLPEQEAEPDDPGF